MDHLLGRTEVLAALDKAWDDSSTNVLVILAWGGVGKTSIIVEWMARKAALGWQGFDRVFDWSFYSQGTREQGTTFADSFITAALEFSVAICCGRTRCCWPDVKLFETFSSQVSSHKELLSHHDPQPSRRCWRRWSQDYPVPRRKDRRKYHSIAKDLNRQLQPLTIAAEFAEALDTLRCTLDAEAFQWADCEALERRSGFRQRPE